ncbi:chemotaxis protein CheA [Bacillus sp. T3]|uniref:chemotaxis protein CheA n=1 Tax=Bacillus sp. T3 TaxID=467262 RepID=UPI0029819C75|nr:chemotaxis protein CheA [Bacillus sp. T3]
MNEQYNDPMLEAFLFETSQQVEELEQSVINAETTGEFSTENVNEIFRIMHTIKSSAAMMLFINVSTIAHTLEDLFYFLREKKPTKVDTSILSDLVLEGIDFIKLELEKIKNGDQADGDEAQLIQKITEHLNILKQINGIDSSFEKKELKESKQQYYISPENLHSQNNNSNAFKSIIHFQAGIEMENIRAYMIKHNLQDFSNEIYHIPEDITDNNESAEVIKRDGFILYFKNNKSIAEMHEFFSQLPAIDFYDLIQIDNIDQQQSENNIFLENKLNFPEDDKRVLDFPTNPQNKMISVNVQKLDLLMDLVGELVISEDMVTKNPDLKDMHLENFQKAARQLRKITSEIQDIVMSIRMVPLGPTFFKMNRIVRDMSKSLMKEVHLEISGEETEVDKNIIDNLSDPLMHIVRNALDHGLEPTEERVSSGKTREGVISLEAKNAGSEVVVTIKDDGRGLNKDKIILKAMQNGLLTKSPDEMTDREIFNLIFLPGFSTKDVVTEYSGRGVGMDVVNKNIEAVGGSIYVDSIEKKGTTITIKIPLTLAIIEGMNIKVGQSRYTIPLTSIKESFRPKKDDVFIDPDGNEMIMIRGGCYPVLRLHKFFNVKTEIINFHEGILIMLEHDQKAICLFVDELLGEQQVVVKALPDYIKNLKKIKGLAGCTLLGDGSISLILDVDHLY